MNTCTCARTFGFYSLRRMGAGTQRKPSTRCATSNAFCGADRHNGCIRRAARSSVAFSVYCNACSLPSRFPNGRNIFAMLDADIQVDGITYVEFACIAPVMPLRAYNTGNNSDHRMETAMTVIRGLNNSASLLDCIRRLLYRSWLLSPCFFRLQTRWTSPQWQQVLVLRLSPHRVASFARYAEPFLRRRAT
jgi:hypothetical protein